MILMGLLPGLLLAQEALSLTDCQEAARTTHPLQRQALLVQTQAELQAAQARSQWLPSLSLNGQLTYQSDVITFPSLGPGLEFPQLPQTQYRATLDVQQTLYEGGAIRYAQDQAQLGAQVQQQAVAVEVEKQEATLNSLYFGVLMLQAQDSVLASTEAELQARRESLVAGVTHGVLLPSVVDGFDKQLVTLAQQRVQLAAEMASLREMLATWTGLEAARSAPLSLPEDLPAYGGLSQQLRPEYGLWDLQREQLELSQESLRSRALPKLAAFAQAGVGQPNPFNFLNTDFAGFYMVGLRLNWQPWDWKRTQRDRQIMGVQAQMLTVQQDRFEQALTAQTAKDRQQVATLATLLEQDAKMIELQTRIEGRASTQLENGVITSTEYLTEVNAL
ncbi:MAG: TolC family protein, partial [Bacteroidetes bacterium]